MLRTNRPAPINSSSESDTWTTTSALRSRTAALLPATLPASSFSVGASRGRVACSAGTRPNRMPVTTVAANAAPATRRSIAVEMKGSSADTSSESSGAIEAVAISRPRAPPASAMTRALDQQLLDDAPPAGAEREADGDLALTRRGARDLQVGDVGAGNQQHAADQRHQHPQRLRERRRAYDQPCAPESTVMRDRRNSDFVYAEARANDFSLTSFSISIDRTAAAAAPPAPR